MVRIIAYININFWTRLSCWFIKKKPSFLTVCKMWLGWLDSNQRMSAPKADALPLGDTPIFFKLSLPWQRRLLYHIEKPMSSIFWNIFRFFSVVLVFRITNSYILNGLNNPSIFLSHFVDYEYSCADQYKSNQRLKAECLLCLSEQKRRKKHTANRVHKAENSNFRYGVVL